MQVMNECFDVLNCDQGDLLKRGPQIYKVLGVESIKRDSLNPCQARKTGKGFSSLTQSRDVANPSDNEVLQRMEMEKPKN